MKIPENIVDQILNAAKIEDVIRSYGVDLRKAGSVLKACCPFHDEKTPSFVVSPAKGIYKCFGCGKGGNVTSFVMEKEGCTYPEALRILAKRYNIEVPEREMTEEEKRQNSERQNMFALNEWYAKWLTESMMNDPEGRAVGLSYFRSRAFTDESIKNFQLGYSLPKGSAATDAAKKAGFAEKLLIESGITGKNEQGRLYDRFRGRVMFPIHNVTGKIVAFGGRILEKKENVGKYVNTPENIVYHKSNELYGLFQAKNEIVKKSQCILVEGYADVISMHQAGIRNAVASCGTSLTEEQVKVIKKFAQTILIIYDGDAAGVKAALRAIDMTLGTEMTVKLVLLPNGADPDDFAKEHNTDEIEEYLKKEAMDYVDYQVKTLLDNKLDDPIRVNDALTQILDSTARIKDDMTREIFVKKIAKIFDLDRKVIVGKMQSLLNEFIKEEEAKNAREKAPNGFHAAEEGPINIEQQNWKSSLNIPAIEKPKELWIREKEIVQFILRHIEETIAADSEETNEKVEVRITDYMLAFMQDMVKEDGSIFENDLYQEFLDILQSTDNPTITMFTNNEDENVRNLAATLILDKYQLSKRFNKEEKIKISPDSEGYAKMLEDKQKHDKEEHDRILLNDARTLLTEYKTAVLNERIDNLMKEMQVSSTRGIEILREIQNYRMIIQQLKEKN